MQFAIDCVFLIFPYNKPVGMVKGKKHPFYIVRKWALQIHPKHPRYHQSPSLGDGSILFQWFSKGHK